jgi:hypothetical protein
MSDNRKEIGFSIPLDKVEELKARACLFGFFGKYALSNFSRHALFVLCNSEEDRIGRRVFSVRYDANVGEEIEQQAYGKGYDSVEKWITHIIAKEVSRNGLTAAQYKRIEERYGERTLTRLRPLAAPLRGNDE